MVQALHVGRTVIPVNVVRQFECGKERYLATGGGGEQHQGVQGGGEGLQGGGRVEGVFVQCGVPGCAGCGEESGPGGGRGGIINA